MAGENKRNNKKANQESKDLLDSQTATLETPVYELKRGMTFANRYEIIEELGRGGMGKVYRAEDVKIDEEVALKLLKPEISIDKKYIERFSNEIKLARRISHRNVCRMYHFGEERGLYYITMEYVLGEDLKTTLRRVGPLSAGKAIFIAKQICEGLSEAHRLGVVHRDLKPQNIMIDKQGNVRIMDFGVARFVRGKSITDVGTVVGTPEYMSPEQASAKDVDRRADIYSLGVILYEMVSGRTPFSGDTALSVAIKHKSEKPKQPKELNEQIPEELNQLILKCLEKDKQRRYQHAKELLQELSNIEKGIPTTERVVPKERPFTSKEITVKFSVKKFLTAAALVFFAGLLGFAIWKLIPGKETESKASLSVPSGTEDTSLKKTDSFVNGLELWEKSKYEEALVQFRAAVDKDPSHIKARIKIAEILQSQKKTEEAIQEYKKVIERKPSDPLSYKKLAEIYEKQNDLLEARSYYQQYLELAPQDEQYTMTKDHVDELESRIKAEKPQEESERKYSAGKEQKSRETEEQAVRSQTTSDPMKETTKIKQKLGSQEKKVKQSIKKADPENKDQEKKAITADPENTKDTRKEHSSEIAEKMKKKSLVSDKLDTGIQEFEKGNYKKTLSLMQEVLEMSPEHTEANKYVILSEKKIAEQSVQQMVHHYADALQNQKLISFYESHCTAEFYPEIKKDAEWLMRTYKDLNCLVSDVTVQFGEKNTAEVEISLIITGTSQRDEIKQALFEGVYKWNLIEQNGTWKIVEVSSQASRHPKE
ncbi:MAG: protein kinase [Candidatus Aminicenantes bacterium]|nr:protein kinase [Candidatus Aminicenantes bacterium]